MGIVIVCFVIFIILAVYDYYKYYVIVSIAKEIAQERYEYCQANWDDRRYVLPPWEELTIQLWVEYCVKMLEQPLQLHLSMEQYLLKDICEFITEPPFDDVIDIVENMIKEAYNIAENRNEIFRTRHIVYVETYYRIGMYKSALNSVCNIP